MRKMLTVCVVLVALCLVATSVFAALSLHWELDGKEGWDVTGNTCRYNLKEIKIYLDGWDTTSFHSEMLLGVQLFVFHDKYDIRINLENSYPNDTWHGGPFDPGLSSAQYMERGKLKLVTSVAGCVSVTDHILLWTLEYESISYINGDIEVQLDFPGAGGAVPSGVGCTVPMVENAVGSYATINIWNVDQDENGCYDWCECQGDFDHDLDVDGTDLFTFKENFFRKDCTTPNPCNGDFNCDGDVDGSDGIIIKRNYFRKSYGLNPCPLCAIGACPY